MVKEFSESNLSGQTMALKYSTAWAGVILMAVLKAIEPEDDR